MIARMIRFKKHSDASCYCDVESDLKRHGRSRAVTRDRMMNLNIGGEQHATSNHRTWRVAMVGPGLDMDMGRMIDMISNSVELHVEKRNTLE